MTTAVIYARYSSHAQKDASIEQQLADCYKYAKANDITIVGEYCDRHISGRTDEREEFLRMIKDSARQKWNYVIIWKTDRFARNRYDSAVHKAKLKKNGVRVLSAMEAIPEGPEGILLESILEGSAEYYSANLSQNVKRGMTDNAKNCMVNSGTIPFGYKKGADGRFEIDPPAAEIVKEIYTLYSEGHSAAEITELLNNRGITTLRGKPWGKCSLTNMLRNERYTGVYIWDDIRVEGGMPQIISRELFEKVQKRKRHIKRAPAASRSDVDFIMTGKMFCGHCGANMIGSSGTSETGNRYYYYACANHKHHHTCKKKRVRKEWIEELIVRGTREYCLSDESIKNIAREAVRLQKEAKKNSILTSLNRELASVNRSIGNIMKAIERGIFTDTTKDRLEELEDRKKLLEAAIIEESYAFPDMDEESITLLLKGMRHGDPSDPDYRLKFIRAFVTAVYLYDDHFRVVMDITGHQKALSYAIIDELPVSNDTVKEFAFEGQSFTNLYVGELSQIYVSSRYIVGIIPLQQKGNV
jgi:DNA invertase Pin-like site-specific DNA recombinase